MHHDVYFKLEDRGTEGQHATLPSLIGSQSQCRALRVMNTLVYATGNMIVESIVCRWMFLLNKLDFYVPQEDWSRKRSVGCAK